MRDPLDIALLLARRAPFRGLPDALLLDLAARAEVVDARAPRDPAAVYVERDAATLVRLARDDVDDAVDPPPAPPEEAAARAEPPAPPASPRGFLLGAATVFLTAAATVAIRAYADAVFLDVYGPSLLPQFFIVQALAFAAATIAYDTAARRARGGALDGVVMAAFGAAAAGAPLFAGRDGPTTFVVALILVALSSVASLAAWNVAGATVRGRETRRLLPRVAAALTAGGVLAGFGASAFIARFGLGRLPLCAAALAAAILGCAALAARARAAPPPPEAAPPPGEPAPAPRALVRWLAAAAVVEALLNVLVEMRFKSELAAAYGGDQLGVVLAAFMGTTNGLLLLLQLLLVPRLLVSRSLPVSAAVHPVGVAAAVGAGLLVPGFASAALARAADSVLRAATARTTQDLSLSALPERPRQRWKVLLRGAFIPLGSAAAGVWLLAAPPPAWVALALAFGLALATRRAARAFLDALAAPLGVRTAADPPAGLELDALLRLIERSGSADPDEARLARAAILAAGHAADELSPHLLHPDAAVRAALFQLAARRPSPAAASDLRAAVAVEDDDAALAAGLRALAAHDDDAAVDRARALARTGGAVGRAAAAYLAQLGRLPEPEARAALAAVAAVDGAWAAAVARGAGLEVAAAGEGLQALRFAVASGAVEPWLAALRAREPLAMQALAGQALPEQALAARERDAATWVAVLGAARHAAGAGALVDDLLAHPAAEVREAAARAAARRPVAPEALQRALAVELELLDGLLARRAPAAETRRALSRTLSIAALAGNGAAVRAAGRRLLSPDGDERRRAMDVLQEVTRAHPRLTAAVERWLSAAG